jgi:hypothetical protein
MKVQFKKWYGKVFTGYVKIYITENKLQSAGTEWKAL